MSRTWPRRHAAAWWVLLVAVLLPASASAGLSRFEDVVTPALPELPSMGELPAEGSKPAFPGPFDAADETVGSDRLIRMTHNLEGGPRFYLFDGLGSVTTLTDPLGAPTARYHLDAWGVFRQPSEATASQNRFGFTGYIYHAPLNLYFAKARFYDPEVGRFTTQDSYLGEADQPPTLHRYTYTANNPTKYVDLTGHDFTVVEQTNWKFDEEGSPYADGTTSVPQLTGTVTNDDYKLFLAYVEKHGTREEYLKAVAMATTVYSEAYARGAGRTWLETAAAAGGGVVASAFTKTAAVIGAAGGAAGGFTGAVLEGASAADVAIRTTAGAALGSAAGWVAGRVGRFLHGVPEGEVADTAAEVGRRGINLLKPRGIPPTPDEVAAVRIARAEFREHAAQVLKKQTADKAVRISTQGSPEYMSNTERGPVLTGVADPQTGELFFDVNDDVVAPNLTRVLEARLAAYMKATNGITPTRAGVPGAHSEINALNQALKARELRLSRPATDTDLEDMLMVNRALQGARRGTGIPPRCDNCRVLTDGVEMIEGK